MATPARAADPAEDAYRTAMEMAERGDIDAARRVFERAYALDPRWKFAINCGKLALLDRDLLDADRWIARAERLAASPAERQKTAVERAVCDRLLDEGGFGRVELALVGAPVQAVVTINGLPMDRRGDPYVAWVRAGKHLWRVDAEGCPPQQAEVLVRPADRMRREVEVCAAPVRVAPIVEVAEGATQETATQPRQSEFPLIRTAATLGLLGAAGSAYWLALDHAEQARATAVTDADSKQRYLDGQKTAQVWRAVAVGALGGAAIVASWMATDWLWPTRTTAAVGLVPVGEGAVLVVTGDW